MKAIQVNYSQYSTNNTIYLFPATFISPALLLVPAGMSVVVQGDGGQNQPVHALQEHCQGGPVAMARRQSYEAQQRLPVHGASGWSTYL